MTLMYCSTVLQCSRKMTKITKVMYGNFPINATVYITLASSLPSCLFSFGSSLFSQVTRCALKRSPANNMAQITISTHIHNHGKFRAGVSKSTHVGGPLETESWCLWAASSIPQKSHLTGTLYFCLFLSMSC